MYLYINNCAAPKERVMFGKETKRMVFFFQNPRLPLLVNYVTQKAVLLSFPGYERNFGLTIQIRTHAKIYDN